LAFQGVSRLDCNLQLPEFSMPNSCRIGDEFALSHSMGEAGVRENRLSLSLLRFAEERVTRCTVRRTKKGRRLEPAAN
jgi:hypothetical protein